MKLKIGDYVRVISCYQYPKLIGECGIIKTLDIDGNYYRILFSNLGYQPVTYLEGGGPIYTEFINLWGDNELKKLTKDEAMVEML